MPLPRQRYHPLYSIHRGMIDRCYNKNCISYPKYGGIGRKVCDRWLGKEGFANFVKDIGPRPSPLHSVDRYPDPHGNYEPNNTRWATAKEQARNKINSSVFTENGIVVDLGELADKNNLDYVILRDRWIAGDRGDRLIRELTSAPTHLLDGEFYTIKQLSEMSGKPHSLLYDRIVTRKIPVKEAITTPSNSNPIKNIVNYLGEDLSLEELSNKLSISYSTIRDRYARGMRGDDLTISLYGKHTKKYLYRGEYKTLKELSKISKLKFANIKNRICFLKWSIEDAVNIPVNKYPGWDLKLNGYDLIDYNKEKISLDKLSDITKLPIDIVIYRAKQKYDVDWIIKNEPKRKYYFKGLPYTLTELSIISGLDMVTIKSRLRLGRNSVEDALSKELRVKVKKFYPISENTLLQYNNEYITLLQFSIISKIKLDIVKYRYIQHVDAHWILHDEYDNRYYEYQGHKYNIAELAILSNNPYPITYDRVRRLNWSIDRVVNGE